MLRRLFLVILTVSGILSAHAIFAHCIEGQIDINSATEESLQELSGIGPTYAGRIISGRPFESLDDLTKVKGIGEATLQKIKSQGMACVGKSSINTTSPKNSSFSEAPQTSEPLSMGQNIVLEPSRPIARAGRDITTNVGSLVHFDGSQSSDPEGKELIYTWNLGDGNYKEGASFDYNYQYPGSYIVTLEVNNKRSISTDSIKVTVYPQAVFISEFLPNPAGKDKSGEWIEIENNSLNVVDLSGWKIQDSATGSSAFVLPAHSLLGPRSFLVLARQTTKIALNNDGDKIKLLYPTGEVADEVSYKEAKEGLAAAKKGDKFFWTEVVTPGTHNLIFLAGKSAQKKNDTQKAAKVQSFTLQNTRLTLVKSHQVNNLCYNNPLTYLQQKDFHKKVLVPLVSDMDDILKPKKAFAQSKNAGIIAGQKEKNLAGKALQENETQASLQKNTLFRVRRFNPAWILFGSSVISSLLFGEWVVILKKKYF